jgi:hypothetical protein
MRWIAVTLAPALFSLSLAFSAYAQTIAYDAPAQFGNQAFVGNLGLDFDVNSPIVVTAFGAFNGNPMGFAGTINVGIFNRDTMSQLGQTIPFNGKINSTLINGDRFTQVTPLLLQVGHYSVVAQGFSNEDPNGNSTLATPPPFTASTENSGGGLISFVGSGRYDNNIVLDFPTTIPPGAPSNVFLAGTFQFVAAQAPTITKSFGVPNIGVNAPTVLYFTITGSNAALSGLTFTDTLPAGIVIATPNGLTGAASCFGTVTATAGSSTIKLVNGALNPTKSCSFSVNVTGTMVGAWTNSTGPLSDDQGLTGTAATATLNVVNPPTLTKSFSDPIIQLNFIGTSANFTVTNPAGNPVTQTAIGFGDTLPPGLIVANDGGNPVSGSCGGGTITAVAGSNTISLGGASLAAGASCSFSVRVLADPNAASPSLGDLVNTTDPITSFTGQVVGLPATATTNAIDLFYLWFFFAG